MKQMFNWHLSTPCFLEQSFWSVVLMFLVSCCFLKHSVLQMFFFNLICGPSIALVNKYEATSDARCSPTYTSNSHLQHICLTIPICPAPVLISSSNTKAPVLVSCHIFSTKAHQRASKEQKKNPHLMKEQKEVSILSICCSNSQIMVMGPWPHQVCEGEQNISVNLHYSSFCSQGCRTVLSYLSRVNVGWSLHKLPVWCRSMCRNRLN